MSHAIAFDNGRANLAIIAGKPAWHGLGTEIDNGYCTVAEVCAAAGMLWQPYESRLQTPDGIPCDLKAVRRNTDHKVLGTVGLDRVTLPHGVMFGKVAPIIASKRASWDCVGSLFDGSVYFASLAMGASEIVKGDAVQRYLMIAGSYNAQRKASVGLVTTRVVCNNTLSFACSSEAASVFSYRHTGDVASRMSSAIKIVDAAAVEFAKNDEILRNLAKVKFTDGQLKDLVRKLYPVRAKKLDRKIVAPATPVVASGSAVDSILDAMGHDAAPVGIGGATAEILAETERDLNARAYDRISELWQGGRGTELAGVRGTGWGALNAITEYETHHRGRSEEGRMLATALDDKGGTGARAIDMILEMVRAA